MTVHAIKESLNYNDASASEQLKRQTRVFVDLQGTPRCSEKSNDVSYLNAINININEQY